MRHTNQTRARAIAVAGLMIMLVFSWLGIESSTGFLNTGDEFFTAERSREMLLLGPWTVHDNFEVIGLKPPLQYWLTTLTLPRFQNLELAVRLWPLIYGALTAVALGWLAHVVDRTRPWLIPLSVALLLCCPIFLRETYRALLDSGLTFFATVAIVSAQLARTRPGWWLGVALVCWLGTLQKIPLIVLLWLIIIVVRLNTAEGRKTLRTGWLLAAMLATVLALAAWPLIQLFEFRLSVADSFRFREAVDLTARRASRYYFEIPLRLTTTWPCGIFALAGAVLLPFTIRERSRNVICELSFVCLTLIALSVVSNLRNVRYLLPIIPALCFLLALFLYWMLERRKATYTVAVAVVAVLSMAGIAIAQWIIANDRVDHSGEVRIAQELGARQSSSKRLVIVEGNNGIQREEFYLFYGNLRFPLLNLTIDQIRRSLPPPPLLGVCNVRDLGVLQETFPDLEIQSVSGPLICWQAEGQAR